MLTPWVQCRFQATCEAIVRTYSCLKVPITGQDFQPRMLILRSNQSDRSAKCVSFYRIVLIEDLWHEEARRSTRLSTKEAERRAWATVNKPDKGGRKKGGGGRGKSEVNQVPAKVEEKVVEARAAQSTGNRVPDCPRRIVFNGDHDVRLQSRS